jgi:hypothetical protein
VVFAYVMNVLKNLTTGEITYVIKAPIAGYLIYQIVVVEGPWYVPRHPANGLLKVLSSACFYLYKDKIKMVWFPGFSRAKHREVA